MSVKSETEIHSHKAPCAWFALQDRLNKDEINSSLWSYSQIAEMKRLFTNFVRVYGDGNAVMNINQNFFTFKVFQVELAEDHAKNMLKAMIKEMSARPYRFKFNERNEALYNVYPK